MAIEQLWDQADQFLVLWPSERSEATCHHKFIVEGLLGAAASLETSFKILLLSSAARACADGMTCCEVGLGRFFKNRGKRLETQTDPPMSYDRNPIASNRSSEIGKT